MTPETLKRWRESGRELLAAAPAAPASIDEKARTCDIVWYTGASVPRIDWWTGERYMLNFAPGGADLSLLNNGAAVLDDHDKWGGAEGILGTVRKAWKDGDNYLATVQYSPTPDCDNVWGKVAAGIATKYSMGVELMETVETRDEAGKLVSKTATKWRPFELSLTPIPADFGTTTLSAEEPADAQAVSEIIIAGKTFVAEITAATEALRASAQSLKEVPNHMTEQQTTGADIARDAANSEALRAAQAEGARMERERISAINLASTPFLKRKEIDEAFVERFRSEGKSLEEFKAAVWERLAQRTDEIVLSPHQPVKPSGAGVDVDARDKRREGMSACILFRGDPQGFATLRDKSGEFRGMKLVDMARECAELAGVKTRGMDPTEFVRMAMAGPAESAYLGMQSTSDLPNILANVATKSLRAGYEAAPPTFRQVAREVSVPDFKQAKSVNLSDLAALAKVNEHGEFKHTAISDNGEPYSILTYGEIVAVTRQVVINDDLRSLVRVPGAMGQAAARMESDVFWAVVTANAAMSDTVALFHATHNNLLTGAGSALALAGLSAGRAKMRLQTAPKGTILGYVPKYIVAPAALETAAQQLVNPMQLAATAVTGVVPKWVTEVTVVTEARLDANSTTAWYFVAEGGDGLIYCYLEGQQGVYSETRMGFDVDGVEIKVREDFGAAAVEFRTWQKNAGT